MGARGEFRGHRAPSPPADGQLLTPPRLPNTLMDVHSGGHTSHMAAVRRSIATPMLRSAATESSGAASPTTLSTAEPFTAAA